MRLLPEILGEHRQDDRVELDLRVPPDLAYFEGHFPGLPILPGVVQIDWSVRFARDRLGLRGNFAAAENLKFLSIVRPDARLTLTLQAETDVRLAFNYFSQNKKYSSGTLVFGA
jgi:3-hydroxymyristoyl/3-hydroxydecanoyl-(acyl carrier protein) dehydratase